MPNIRELDAGSAADFTPSPRNADDAAAGARAIMEGTTREGALIGGGIAALGAPAQALYNKAVVAPDLAKVDVNASTILAQGTQSWADFNRTDQAAGGDISTRYQRWSQASMEPMLQGMVDSATTDVGRKAAMAKADAYRQHFSETGLADTAAMSADQVKSDQVTTLNNIVNAVQADPTKVDFALSELDKSYNTSLASSSVDPKMLGALGDAHDQHKGVIVAAAMLGLAQKNPYAFQQELNNGYFDKKYGQYLGRADASGVTLKDNLSKAAQGYLQAEHKQQVENNTAAKAQSADLGYQYQRSMYDPQTGDPIPNFDKAALISKILQDPNMRAEDQVNAMKRIQSTKPPAQTSTPGLVNKLLNDPNTSRQDVYKLIDNPVDGQDTLSQTDSNFLLGKLGDKKNDPVKQQTINDGRTAARDIYKPSSTGFLGGVQIPTNDPAQQQSTYQRNAAYQAWFDRAYQAAIASGKDPVELTDPTSKDYLPKQWSGFNAATDSRLLPVTPSAPAADAGPDARQQAIDQQNQDIGTFMNWVKGALFGGPQGGAVTTPPPVKGAAPTQQDIQNVGPLSSNDRGGAAYQNASFTIDANKLGDQEVASGVSLGSVFKNPAAPLSGPVADRQNAALKVFTDGGWSSAQAAGIVGNLMAESHPQLDPTAVNPTSGMKGLAQWDTKRSGDFRAMYGHDVTQGTFNEQLQFVLWELNNTESRAGQMLKMATTAKQAADIFQQYYERANGEGLSARVTNAMSVYARSTLNAA